LAGKKLVWKAKELGTEGVLLKVFTLLDLAIHYLMSFSIRNFNADIALNICKALKSILTLFN
jgi:hypothetical protein